MKYSIIIPTYKHFEDCLKPCLESIIQHTDLQDVEIIVVANGCSDDGTLSYIYELHKRYPNIFSISVDRALGFTNATNMGIEVSKGEYIILLNNDLQIMGANWLEMLEAPFLLDNEVGITGAAKNYHKETESEFILFFCSMTRRDILERVGGIDPIFNPGYGEDIDFCHKLKQLGYKIVQVPNEISLTTVRPTDEHILQFPIWHKGSVTVNEVPEWSQVVPRNEAILLERYKDKAKHIEIGNLLDTVNSWEVIPRLDKITAHLAEDGKMTSTIDNRTRMALSRGGFANGIFIGKDGTPLLNRNENLCDISSLESIREFVLSAGSKNLYQFGGRFQGGYCLQQDIDELSEYLFDCRDLKVEHYLEIGVADGGVTRIFCDVVQVKDITTIDIGWADMNYPLNYRQNLLNCQNTGKIDIYRGDSHAPEVEKFLEGKKFDFIFIDAGHEYEDVVKDTELAKKYAADGAIFAYHDHIACEGVTRFFYEYKPDMQLISAYESPNPEMRKGISMFRYTPFKLEKTDPVKDVSIIIPTYNHLEDCLKSCLQSIINTTDLSNVEVIVVANGCTDDTKQYVDSLGGTFKLIWIDEPVGFIKATNAGIRAAIGKYIVFLNNDTEVLKSTWLNILKKPFIEGTNVGITGPYKDWRFFWDDNVLTFREEYMVFFCAMTTRAIIDKVGLLDEDFGMGYEEDIDFAIRVKKLGYKLVQVPTDRKDDLSLTKEYLSNNPNQLWREFPLIHKDAMTFSLEKNKLIGISTWDSTKKTSLLQKYPTKPRISIVIPTYNNLDLLKGCIASIQRYTDLTEIEVIIVANGCTDATREYVYSLGNPFKLYWIDQRVGFIKATNAGIKESMGEFIILLNNDVELRPQEKDQWIKLLLTRFVDNVGIVGPMKAWRDDVRAEYMLFWCVMIKREVFKEIGLLDEIFGEGYHEDVDFCIRAQQAGFKLVETPEDINYNHENQGDSSRVGSFPIMHIGGGTFAPLYGQSKQRLEQYVHHLYNKYGVYLEKELPGGWFGWDDQAFYKELIRRIPDGGVMAEIGVWMGRSLCSAAEIIKEKNIQVHAIDTFKGSPWEMEDGAQVKGMDLLQIFKDNIERFGLTDYVKIYPMDSADSAFLFNDKSCDLVFIDADHRYEGVQRDVKAWLPKVKDGCLITGHDIQWNDSVAPALYDLFGRENVFSGANIWYVLPENRYKKWFKQPIPRGKVIDTCIFYNEVELFKMRVEELYDVVDKFVVVESLFDHQGNAKPMYFDWKSLGDKADKVHYILLHEFPNCTSTWDREHYQRRAIMDGLADYQPNDIIIMSDCDEIVRKEVIQKYQVDMGVCAIEMSLFYYKLDWQIEERWFKARIFPFSALFGKDMQSYRGKDDYVYNMIIPNGGWHFSFLGDVKSVKQKIQAYSHSEFNNDYFTNDQHLEDAILNGKDIFRRNLHFTKIIDFSNHPKYVQDNLQYYKDKQLITSSQTRSYKVFDCFSFFNELDLLEIRLNELYNQVDYFIISEMEQTHSGKPKPLYLSENLELFAKWSDKIIIVIPPNIETVDPWVREHHQRDFIINALEPIAKDEDMIIVSDLDEIPRASKIDNYEEPKFFEQNQFSYYLNYNVGISTIAPSTFSRIAPMKFIRERKLSLTGLRYEEMSNDQKISDGGWHFSWMGGSKAIIQKLEGWAHQELNTLEYKDSTRINYLISQGREHFGRNSNIITKKWEIDHSFPIFVQENQQYLTDKGLLDVSKVAIIMPYYNDEANLLKSVSAITGQSFLNWTLFIIDDGSEDRQKAVKILASHPKITIIEKENGGPSSARNMGLNKVTSGDFTHIAFCDSDDIWDKDYMMKQLNKIDINDIIYSSVRHQFDNGQEAIPYGIPDPLEYPGGKIMLETPFIFISGVVCRYHVLSHQRFDDRLDSIEDWDMWLRLDDLGCSFIHNPEKLLTYTVKSTGMAPKRTEEKTQLLKNKYANVRRKETEESRIQEEAI